jgi:GDPmannose 4,6-dehydratase
VKRVVIIGSAGQDGRILRAQLDGNSEIIGVDRGEIHASNATGWKTPVDVLDFESIASLVRSFVPDELYYLAAHHHASEDKPGATPALVQASLQIHVVGWTHTLEAIATHAPHARAFYASSSHVFGSPPTTIQDETTPLAPTGVYGVTKAAGMHMTRLYRTRGLFASSGILYNHESSYRGAAFVSRKIVTAARAQQRVRLGRLDAVVDWGFADDTVRAMRAILNHAVAADFVVATGKPHTVRDFAALAYGARRLDWRDYVDEDVSVLRKEQSVLIGDASKLRTATGWSPSVTFEEMVVKLVND